MSGRDRRRGQRGGAGGEARAPGASRRRTIDAHAAADPDAAREAGAARCCRRPRSCASSASGAMRSVRCGRCCGRWRPRGASSGSIAVTACGVPTASSRGASRPRRVPIPAAASSPRRPAPCGGSPTPAGRRPAIASCSSRSEIPGAAGARSSTFSPAGGPPGSASSTVRGERGFVTPYRDDAEWLVDIARGDVGEARDGDVVVVRPVPRRAARARGNGGRRGARAPMPRPAGEVVEVLGPPGHPEADFRAVVWRRRLRLDFPARGARRRGGAPRRAPRRGDLRAASTCATARS